MKTLFTILTTLFTAFTVWGQLPGEDNNTIPAFRSVTLINTQTTVIIPKGGFDFSIRHRFGSFGFDMNAVKNFFGLDQVANIRFGFALPVTETMYIGAGRTKSGKTYDVEMKQLLMSQTDDGRHVVSVAAYFDAAINTADFSPVADNAFFENGTTPFKNKFTHRLSYNTQIIVSRTFGSKTSVQLTPVLIYKNLQITGNDNYTVALAGSAAYKTGVNSSVMAEYTYWFNNQPVNNLYPLSVGVEFGTTGHVFQIIVSSSQELTEQNLYTSECFDYTKAKLLLGFNIKRTFWKKTKPGTFQ